jgi:succinyl-CoA synthetase beta subunit
MIGRGMVRIVGQKRLLSIHEYHSMNLLKEYGIPVPKGEVAKSPKEALKVAQAVKSPLGLVIKAQVLAGGRGKGNFASGFKGGVHLVKTAEEVEKCAEKMLGGRLITKQTGAEGKPCDVVYVVERKQVKKEFYFAILMDRQSQVFL